MSENIKMLLGMLSFFKEQLSKEEFKVLLDEKVLDPIEDKIEDTNNKIDDFIGSIFIGLIRWYFKIEDND